MNLKWLRLVIAVLLAAVVLGACGDDEEGADDDDGAGEQAAASEINVKTSEYAYSIPSPIVRGGLVELTLDNTGGKEPHEAELVRLDPGKTMADLKAAAGQQGPPPAWAHPEGGPGPIDPGTTAVYTGNLEAGTYVLQCHVPAPDGKDHLAHGMITEIKVEAGEEGEIPEGDVTVGANEYDFTNTDKLKAGEQTVRVENQGKEAHHWAMAALAPGKTAQDAIAFFSAQTPPAGPPPTTGFPGLVATLAPGDEAARTLELKSGTTYLMICFIPAPDGQPHAAKGMLKEIKIA